MVFKFILAIDGWDISHEISSRWMSLDLTDDKSALVQAMAWCRQATSHYLSQCWPRSVSPYGIIRPQWVNPCHDFILGNTKRYLHFTSLLKNEMMQIVEILPHGRQGLVYLTRSIPWMLITWRGKEPGHQQPWYWPSFSGFNNYICVADQYEIHLDLA